MRAINKTLADFGCALACIRTEWIGRPIPPYPPHKTIKRNINRTSLIIDCQGVWRLRNFSLVIVAQETLIHADKNNRDIFKKPLATPHAGHKHIHSRGGGEGDYYRGILYSRYRSENMLNSKASSPRRDFHSNFRGWQPSTYYIVCSLRSRHYVSGRVHGKNSIFKYLIVCRLSK